MSVVVSGIEPPKNCYVCSWYSKVKCRVDRTGRCFHRAERHPDCPISPLPEQHGGLIDRVELAEKVKEVAYPIVHGVNNHEQGITVFGLQMLISEMNVVVPAERGEREKENL